MKNRYNYRVAEFSYTKRLSSVRGPIQHICFMETV